MKILRLGLLVFGAFLLGTCSKRPFVHVWVKGRVVSSRTGVPQTAAVSLWKGKPGSTSASVFVNSRTGSDGTFSIKSHAQYDGNNYYVEITPDSIYTYSLKDVSCPINKGQTVNLGDIHL